MTLGQRCANLHSKVFLLCRAPVFAASDLTHPFKLEIDASAVGAGVVLLQEDVSRVDHPALPSFV